MDILKFKKLEKEIEKNTFESSNKNTNLTLKILSFLGNVASIGLASFFIHKLIKTSVTVLESEWLIWLITLVTLGSLEMIKRMIFKNFSSLFVKKKTIFDKKVLPLFMISLSIIAMSFYSSLSGAKEISSKTDLIENVATDEISDYKDSMNIYYNEYISELESEIKGYKLDIKEKDNEQKRLNEQLAERGYLYRSEKARNTQLSEEKVTLKEDIEKAKTEIESYKSERDTKITEFESTIIENSEEEKNKNSNNSVVFIAISTLIEFLILFGIYFNAYYLYRSYKELKYKIYNNSTYNDWFMASELIEIIYSDDTDIDFSQPILPIEEIVDICEIQGSYITEKEIKKFLRLFKFLKITRVKEKNTFLLMDKKEANEILKENFKIEGK